MVPRLPAAGLPGDPPRRRGQPPPLDDPRVRDGGRVGTIRIWLGLFATTGLFEFQDTGALVSAYAGPRDQLYLVRPDCYLPVRIELAAPEALVSAVERALDIFSPCTQHIQG